MRILYMVSLHGRGGTGETAARTAKALAGRGHRVTIVSRPGALASAIAQESGIDLDTSFEMRWGFHPVSFLGDVRRLARLARKERIDIAHAHRSIEYWIAGFARLLGARFKLVRSRGITVPISGHIFNRWLHNRLTDMVIVTATSIGRGYAPAGFDGGKIRVALDGIDAARFAPGLDGGPLRARMGLAEGESLIVSVARLEPVKGHEFLLEAAAELAPRCRFKLALIGEGGARGAIEEQIARLALGDRVELLGSRRDVPEILNAADIFVLSSVGSEGSSRATLEAMACGVPVVAASVGCLPDVVEDGRTGFLVPPRDPKALASKMEALLADPGLRKQMGAAGRRRVEELFTEEKLAERIEALYRQVLGESP